MSANERLLPKLGAQSEPPVSYGSSAGGVPMDPPAQMHMATRSRHVPTVTTEDESVFFFTTPLAGLAGLVCCPLTVCGMPTSASTQPVACPLRCLPTRCAEALTPCRP